MTSSTFSSSLDRKRQRCSYKMDHSIIGSKSLDFYFWGHLKSSAYSTPVENEEKLRQRMFNVANKIVNSMETLRCVNNNFVRRLQKCVDLDGGHFQNSFYCYFYDKICKVNNFLHDQAFLLIYNICYQDGRLCLLVARPNTSVSNSLTDV